MELFMYVNFSFLLIDSLLVFSQKGPCDNRSHGCCSETIWNETLQKCTVCGPGYFGEFCNMTCIYPDYGMGCRMMCYPEQNKESYDFRTGCADHGVSYSTDSAPRQTTAEENDDEKKPTSVSFSTKDIHPSFNNTGPRKNSIPDLQITVIVLFFALFVILVLYLFSQKCVKSEEETDAQEQERNPHYEDVKDIQINLQQTC
ncbi:uncharacterized protein LOC134259433 isoform X1 [Saccostrea cucullata]|uniref:uncharacterized protein LOC134259433 isoform X1 n=1 Tax=Saccostrea cuccullata TaxID=36930 RepID=UPI002ED07C6C